MFLPQAEANDHFETRSLIVDGHHSHTSDEFTIISRGNKTIRCQVIADLEASVFRRKSLQIWRHISQTGIIYEESLEVSGLAEQAGQVTLPFSVVLGGTIGLFSHLGNMAAPDVLNQ